MILAYIKSIKSPALGNLMLIDKANAILINGMLSILPLFFSYHSAFFSQAALISFQAFIMLQNGMIYFMCFWKAGNAFYNAGKTLFLYTFLKQQCLWIIWIII